MLTKEEKEIELKYYFDQLKKLRNRVYYLENLNNNFKVGFLNENEIKKYYYIKKNILFEINKLSEEEDNLNINKINFIEVSLKLYNFFSEMIKIENVLFGSLSKVRTQGIIRISLESIQTSLNFK